MTNSGQQTIREKLNISSSEFIEMGRIGAMYYQQGKIAKARTIFEGLVELDPENSDARAALGALLTLQQEDDDAIIHLEKSIEINPSQIAPYVNLGEVFIRKEKIEEAVKNLKIAIELDPNENDPGANRARAMILGIYQIISLNNPDIGKNNLTTEKSTVNQGE
jgi:tetratricopeptide (TPR) repeat protein